MNIVNTDSLGLEILNQISAEENEKTITPYKTKEEAINKFNENKITLFIIKGAEELYFALETEVYNKWIKDYKIEGVEI